MPAVVVMGVSGAGKSSVGAALAAALGRSFCEGDTLHPPGNVARMRAGTPLTDNDRAPWLDRVAAWIAKHPDGVVSCSALKRAYRDRLRLAAPDITFVLLDLPEAVLADRLARRPGHFMPAALLASQLATLEPPGADERAVVVESSGSMENTVERIVAKLAPGQPLAPHARTMRSMV